MLKSKVVSLVIFLGISVNCIIASSNSRSQYSSDVFQTIMENVQSLNKDVSMTTMEKNTAYYITVVQADGSFPDIDYNSRAQTVWAPVSHLDRLKSIVLAYTMQNSKYYGDENVYNLIVRMFQFWYDKHPTSTNWFMQEIACPQRVGVMLILMRSGATPLPAALEINLLNRMKTEGGRPDQSGSQGTAANKLDIATHWIYRGCLTRDNSVLTFGIDQAYLPISLTMDEGLQHDFSYQQHGNQLYTGGYGYTIADGISKISLFMVGTQYELSGTKLNLLSSFIIKSYIPSIRGEHFLFNALGRGVARKNGLKGTSLITILNRMIKLDAANTNTYQDAINRIYKKQNSSYNIQPLNSYFWRSDYTLHQRPGYTIELRTASQYTGRNENGNGENLKGYFMTDGGTDIALNGDEYVDIFPVWDWARIPGITAPAVTTIPKPGQWFSAGTSPFTGGVSDGKYSVNTYLLNDYNYSINTTARKSWFFFDDEVVCLGAGIRSMSAIQINTTVNQSRLLGDVTTCINGAEAVLADNSSKTSSDMSWVLHGGVGYYFPQGGAVTVRNMEQTGNWQVINSSLASEPASMNVFKMWFNHGIAPVNDKYSYIIVPNKNTAEEARQYQSDNVSIILNTDSVQAVKHNNLDILGIVFYRPAVLNYGDISVKVDKACTVLLRDISTSEVKAYISDPTRKESSVTMIAKFPAIEGYKQQKYLFSVYPDPYAGSTKEYTINHSSPTYIQPTYDYLPVSEDAWVRDGSYATVNNGTASTLVVKKDNVGYAREAYVKFDLSGVNTNDYTKYLVSLSVSHSNKSIADIKWNIGYVSNDNWTENTLVWNNKPAVDNIISTVPAVASGSYILVDITSIVLDEIRNKNKILTLHISSTDRGADGGTDAQFYSKESGNPTKQPRLFLQKKVSTPSDAVEVNVSEDSWVRDGSYSTTNYGANNTLMVKTDGVGYNRETYLKFNLENTNFNNIESIKLRLAVSNANTSVQDIVWSVIPVENNWTESGLTWANRPYNISDDAIASFYGCPAGSIALMDITQYARQQYESGNKIISLKIVSSLGNNGSTDAQFFSKESSDPARFPKLLIEASGTVMTRSDISTLSDNSNKLSVYPNPVRAGESLYIKTTSDSENYNIKLFNRSGVMVKTAKGREIETSKLASGIYALSVQDIENNEIYNTMIIVK